MGAGEGGGPMIPSLGFVTGLHLPVDDLKNEDQGQHERHQADYLDADQKLQRVKAVFYILENLPESESTQITIPGIC